MNSLRAAQNSSLARYKAEATKLARERENIIQAIKDGVPADMIKDELERVTSRQSELTELMKDQSAEPQPFIHPAMAHRYQEEVAALRKALSEQQAAEAREHVRALI
ncbi:MAG: hypothetical protein JSW45_09115, partial [Thiotrichales bacterium]